MYCATLVLFHRDTSATNTCRWLSRCAGFSGTRSGCKITFGTIPDTPDWCQRLNNANILFRYGSLLDDQDLEISVVNSGGREIHREFVHRD
jgi:hypothetical protein